VRRAVCHHDWHYDPVSRVTEGDPALEKTVRVVATIDYYLE